MWHLTVNQKNGQRGCQSKQPPNVKGSYQNFETLGGKIKRPPKFRGVFCALAKNYCSNLSLKNQSKQRLDWWLVFLSNSNAETLTILFRSIYHQTQAVICLSRKQYFLLVSYTRWVLTLEPINSPFTLLQGEEVTLS